MEINKVNGKNHAVLNEYMYHCAFRARITLIYVSLYIYCKLIKAYLLIQSKRTTKYRSMTKFK